jgi:hypothetical protein
MDGSHPDRGGVVRKSIVALACGVLAWQASGVEAADAPSAPAPAVSVGDRWVYRVNDRARKTTLDEVREVTAAGPDGITVRVTRAGDSRDELLSAPGLVRSGAACGEETRRFATPLQRYAFPLEPGKRWNQWVEYAADGRKGKINYNVRMRGWEKVQTAAGSVDALRMLVIVRLDDADAFRNATECNFTVWYAPAVRGPVREQRTASYVTKGSSPMRQQEMDASYELSSFTPGK